MVIEKTRKCLFPAQSKLIGDDIFSWIHWVSVVRNLIVLLNNRIVQLWDEVKKSVSLEADSFENNIKVDFWTCTGNTRSRPGPEHQTWKDSLASLESASATVKVCCYIMCAVHDLVTSNTTFRLPNKTLWMHLCSRQWHLIDCVSTRKKDRQDVRVTKGMCGAECWIDHHLIVSKPKLRIPPM